MRIHRTPVIGAFVALGIHASPLFAAAGSGSGSFGGGGGGSFGGGGGDFGGTGGWGAPVAVTGDPRVFFIVFLVIVIWMMIAAYMQHRRRKAMAGMRDPKAAARRDRRTARRRAERVAAVERKALVAAEDDPAFLPEQVVADAKALFRHVQLAWDNRDRAALATMVGDAMMIEWKKRLDDFDAKGWRNRVSIQGPVTVEYVGLTNLEGEDRDRVVVRISALLEDYVIDGFGKKIYLDGMRSTEAAIREYWVLGRRDGKWILWWIEQELEGEHQLKAPIVPMPVDRPSLSDEALVELSTANRLTPARIAELADVHFEGSALNAARDASLLDRRFDPGVIEASVRRVLAAWVEAVDGPDDALLAVSEPSTLDNMLYFGDPSSDTRLVVRGPQIRDVTIHHVDATATPPRVMVGADIIGVRFAEDRNTTDVLAGSKDRPGSLQQTWELGLTDSDDIPWRVISAGLPGIS